MAPEVFPSLPQGTIIQDKFLIKERIGQGTFSEIYAAKELATGNETAIKVEKKPGSPLVSESKVLRRLQGCKFVCKFFDDGAHEKQQYIVMERLGSSLSDLRRRQSDGRFSMSTTIKLGKKIIEALKGIHEAGFIHRDIKPANVAVGFGENKGLIYVIDFGIAREYVDSNGKVLQAREYAEFRGSHNYASINAHASQELGRRDDLWSLFYLLVESLEGSLPWRTKVDKEEVGKMKRHYIEHPRLLTKNVSFPEEFVSFAEHLNKLKFNETPNYKELSDLLAAAQTRLGYKEDDLFDWEINTQRVPPPVSSGRPTKALPPRPSSRAEVRSGFQADAGTSQHYDRDRHGPEPRRAYSRDSWSVEERRGGDWSGRSGKERSDRDSRYDRNGWNDRRGLPRDRDKGWQQDWEKPSSRDRNRSSNRVASGRGYDRGGGGGPRGYVNERGEPGLCFDLLHQGECLRQTCGFFHPKGHPTGQKAVALCLPHVSQKCFPDCNRYHWTPEEEDTYRRTGLLPPQALGSHAHSPPHWSSRDGARGSRDRQQRPSTSTARHGSQRSADARSRPPPPGREHAAGHVPLSNGGRPPSQNPKGPGSSLGDDLPVDRRAQAGRMTKEGTLAEVERRPQNVTVARETALRRFAAEDDNSSDTTSSASSTDTSSGSSTSSGDSSDDLASPRQGSPPRKGPLKAKLEKGRLAMSRVNARLTGLASLQKSVGGVRVSAVDNSTEIVEIIPANPLNPPVEQKRVAVASVPSREPGPVASEAEKPRSLSPECEKMTSEATPPRPVSIDKSVSEDVGMDVPCAAVTAAVVPSAVVSTLSEVVLTRAETTSPPQPAVACFTGHDTGGKVESRTEAPASRFGHAGVANREPDALGYSKSAVTPVAPTTHGPAKPAMAAPQQHFPRLPADCGKREEVLLDHFDDSMQGPSPLGPASALPQLPMQAHPACSPRLPILPHTSHGPWMESIPMPPPNSSSRFHGPGMVGPVFPTPVPAPPRENGWGGQWQQQPPHHYPHGSLHMMQPPLPPGPPPRMAGLIGGPMPSAVAPGGPPPGRSRLALESSVADVVMAEEDDDAEPPPPGVVVEPPPPGVIMEKHTPVVAPPPHQTSPPGGDGQTQHHATPTLPLREVPPSDPVRGGEPNAHVGKALESKHPPPPPFGTRNTPDQGVQKWSAPNFHKFLGTDAPAPRPTAKSPVKSGLERTVSVAGPSDSGAVKDLVEPSSGSLQKSLPLSRLATRKPGPVGVGKSEPTRGMDSHVPRKLVPVRSDSCARPKAGSKDELYKEYQMLMSGEVDAEKVRSVKRDAPPAKPGHTAETRKGIAVKIDGDRSMMRFEDARASPAPSISVRQKGLVLKGQGQPLGRPLPSSETNGTEEGPESGSGSRPHNHSRGGVDGKTPGNRVGGSIHARNGKLDGDRRVGGPDGQALKKAEDVHRNAGQHDKGPLDKAALAAGEKSGKFGLKASEGSRKFEDKDVKGSELVESGGAKRLGKGPQEMVKNGMQQEREGFVKGGQSQSSADGKVGETLAPKKTGLVKVLLQSGALSGTSKMVKGGGGEDSVSGGRKAVEAASGSVGKGSERQLADVLKSREQSLRESPDDTKGGKNVGTGGLSGEGVIKSRLAKASKGEKQVSKDAVVENRPEAKKGDSGSMEVEQGEEEQIVSRKRSNFEASGRRVLPSSKSEQPSMSWGTGHAESGDGAQQERQNKGKRGKRQAFSPGRVGPEAAPSSSEEQVLESQNEGPPALKKRKEGQAFDQKSGQLEGEGKPTVDGSVPSGKAVLAQNSGHAHVDAAMQSVVSVAAPAPDVVDIGEEDGDEGGGHERLLDVNSLNAELELPAPGVGTGVAPKGKAAGGGRRGGWKKKKADGKKSERTAEERRAMTEKARAVRAERVAQRKLVMEQANATAKQGGVGGSGLADACRALPTGEHGPTMLDAAQDQLVSTPIGGAASLVAALDGSSRSKRMTRLTARQKQVEQEAVTPIAGASQTDVKDGVAGGHGDASSQAERHEGKSEGLLLEGEVPLDGYGQGLGMNAPTEGHGVVFGPEMVDREMEVIGGMMDGSILEQMVSPRGRQRDSESGILDFDTLFVGDEDAATGSAAELDKAFLDDDGAFEVLRENPVGDLPDVPQRPPAAIDEDTPLSCDDDKALVTFSMGLDTPTVPVKQDLLGSFGQQQPERKRKHRMPVVKEDVEEFKSIGGGPEKKPRTLPLNVFGPMGDCDVGMDQQQASSPSPQKGGGFVPHQSSASGEGKNHLEGLRKFCCRFHWEHLPVERPGHQEQTETVFHSDVSQLLLETVSFLDKATGALVNAEGTRRNVCQELVKSGKLQCAEDANAEVPFVKGCDGQNYSARILAEPVLASQHNLEALVNDFLSDLGFCPLLVTVELQLGDSDSDDRSHLTAVKCTCGSVTPGVALKGVEAIKQGGGKTRGRGGGGARGRGAGRGRGRGRPKKVVVQDELLEDGAGGRAHSPVLPLAPDSDAHGRGGPITQELVAPPSVVVREGSSRGRGQRGGRVGGGGRGGAGRGGRAGRRGRGRGRASAPAVGADALDDLTVEGAGIVNMVQGERWEGAAQRPRKVVIKAGGVAHEVAGEVKMGEGAPPLFVEAGPDWPITGGAEGDADEDANEQDTAEKRSWSELSVSVKSRELNKLGNAFVGGKRRRREAEGEV